MMEPYENLANAIVLFAARDYRSALKRLKKNPGGKEAMKCEQFFRSGWYSALSNVSGEYLIEQLQKEVREA